MAAVKSLRQRRDRVLSSCLPRIAHLSAAWLRSRTAASGPGRSRSDQGHYALLTLARCWSPRWWTATRSHPQVRLSANTCDGFPMPTARSRRVVSALRRLTLRPCRDSPGRHRCRCRPCQCPGQDYCFLRCRAAKLPAVVLTPVSRGAARFHMTLRIRRNHSACSCSPVTRNVTNEYLSLGSQMTPACGARRLLMRKAGASPGGLRRPVYLHPRDTSDCVRKAQRTIITGRACAW